MSYLKAKDTISGQEARAYMVIDGNSEEMFFAKRLTAYITKEKSEIKTLGKRGVQYKVKGWKGTGQMNIYYATSRFRRMILDYVEKGEDVYFDIQVINDDPGSGIGSQTVVLKNVNLNKMTAAAFDVDSEALSEDVEFTFDGIELLDAFTAPVLG
ncbi:MAG: phage tail tube protein [Bacillota bacterium]|jgi:hypothetical protein